MTTERPRGQRVVLRRHPEGDLRPDDFAVEDAPAAVVEDGQFLVRNEFASVDPMLRLFVDAKPLDGLLPSLPIGAPIPGAAVGRVFESRHPDYAVGDLVEGRFGWQHFVTSNGAGVNRVDPAIGAPEHALGVGGLPGFTAYVGLDVAGGIRPGTTVLVSGAAGAVGSVVGPLVRSRGGRAVGIVGGAAKRDYLLDHGYDVAIDRTASDFPEQLRTALPEGAQLYFDNVGGPMLMEVLPHIARGGLILVSGLMAQYQNEAKGAVERDNLPTLLHAVMGKGLRLQSFSQFGQDALRPAFAAEIAKLIGNGELKVQMHVEDGLERLPHALCGLFGSSRTGKVVVRVAEPAGEEGK